MIDKEIKGVKELWGIGMGERKIRIDKGEWKMERRVKGTGRKVICV